MRLRESCLSTTIAMAMTMTMTMQWFKLDDQSNYSANIVDLVVHVDSMETHGKYHWKYIRNVKRKTKPKQSEPNKTELNERALNFNANAMKTWKRHFLIFINETVHIILYFIIMFCFVLHFSCNWVKKGVQQPTLLWTCFRTQWVNRNQS